MKKILLGLAGLIACGCMAAAPQALYVKKGDSYTKYNFGVAGEMKFTDNGHKLQISGYSDVINLDEIDCISFNAPTGAGTLTPYAQKQKMIEIGEAVNKLIDLKSIGDLIRMEDAFFNHHYSGDNTFHPASEYDVPEEYWNLHNEASRVIKAIGAIGKGNPAGVCALRAKAIDLYRAADYFGVYTADQSKRQWVKTSEADYLEIHFKGYDGTNYSVRLDCSEQYSKWETADFSGELPETMTLTFKVNSIKIADLTVSSKLVQDTSIAVEAEFNASGYRLTDRMDVTDRLISDAINVYVNGKESIKATRKVYGANLVKYEMMKEDIKEAGHYHDEDGNCCGDEPEALIAHFYRAQAEADVLGMLQMKAQALDFSRLYDIAKDLPDEVYDRNGERVISINSDGSVITVSYDEEEEERQKEDIIGYLENYTDVQFFYDGEPTMQGFLSFDLWDDAWDDSYDWSESNYFGYFIEDGRLKYAYKEDGKWMYNYWSEDAREIPAEDMLFPSKIKYVEREIAPRLTFSDMTSYSFEDFFDEATFTDLINDYESIIDTYESITGQK